MANGRIAWLDIGKGIAIICVVLGHSIAGLDSPIKQAIFSFHMPLFFIYAGITMRPKTTKNVLLSSLKRLMIPFAILFALNTMMVIARSSTIGSIDFGAIGLSLLFSSAVVVRPWGFPAIGMIWFLMALFIARIITNTLLLAFEKLHVNVLIQLLIFSVATAMGILIGRFCFLPFSFDIVPLACLFMYCGFAAKKLDLLGKLLSWPCFFISLAVWLVSLHFCWFSMGDRMFSFAPLAILGAITGTILVSKISKLIEERLPILESPLSFCGVNSLLIFSFHYLEARLVAWSQLPLITSLSIPVAFYAIFFMRFALIVGVILVVMSMPIAAKNRTAKEKS